MVEVVLASVTSSSSLLRTFVAERLTSFSASHRSRFRLAVFACTHLSRLPYFVPWLGGLRPRRVPSVGGDGSRARAEA